MKCHDIRRHWELYYDSEGDSETYFQINEHLSTCPKCARWFFQQSQFEDKLVLKLREETPEKELWKAIYSDCGLLPSRTSRNRLFASSLVIVLGAFIAVMAFWDTRDVDQPLHLASITAAWHRQLTVGVERVEFASQSDQDVENYLRQRVSFPVRCPPRKDAGFLVQGGGVCNITGELIAYVHGRVDGRSVSIFILPDSRNAQFTYVPEVLSRTPVQHFREGNYEAVLAKIDHNVVVVVGDSSLDKLERIIRAYGSYHELPSSQPI